MKSKKNVFTMIYTNNDEFYSKDDRLNLLHLYITERVRGFDQCGMICYTSNEQFARETRSSISTISRAIKLLVELKILWAGYHQESVRNKQRVLHIYDERLGKYYEDKDIDSQNDKPLESDANQNDKHRLSNCLPEISKMTTSDSQNDALVYPRNSLVSPLVTRNDAKPHPLTRAEHSSESEFSYEEFLDTEDLDTDYTPNLWDDN